MRDGFTNIEILVITSVLAGLVYGSHLLADEAKAYLHVIHATLGG